MSKFKFSRSYLPNSVTALNVFCGFASIIFASKGDFHLSALLIFLATFFDLIDGLIARMIGTSSQFGVELDSLSDVVSFGAAPAFLIYSINLNQLDLLGLVISSLLLIFGALRLARFNSQIVDINSKADFKGLPIPISAAVVSSLIITFPIEVLSLSELSNYLIMLVIALSFLMVSNIKYDALPKPKLEVIKKRPLFFVFILIGIGFLVFTKGKAVFYIFILFVLFGILRHIYDLIFNKKDNSSTEINNEINEGV